MTHSSDLRIALVHDWLSTYAGSERVVEQILACYPQADLYSLVDFVPPDQRHFLGGRPVHTSFIQRLPRARTAFRSYLPLMPLAIEQFDLSSYDVIISSSHCVAKGVITGPDQVHLCMCYSPMRYAWDLQHQYLRESGRHRGLRSLFARAVLHYLRMWDIRAANGVDQFIAISEYIARRISKCYRRDSVVIYPPVAIERFTPRAEKDDFYLAASRMVPYKRIDLIVKTFTRLPERRLVVIGDGPQFPQIERIARGASNISLLGYQNDTVLADHLSRAKAFIFAAEEDFGILPVEAQACGTPVIAYGRGGARETVIEGETGTFFDHQRTESIAESVARFDNMSFTKDTITKNAEQFSGDRFRNALTELVTWHIGK